MKRNLCTSCGTPILKSSEDDAHLCRACTTHIRNGSRDRFAALDYTPG